MLPTPVRHPAAPFERGHVCRRVRGRSSCMEAALAGKSTQLAQRSAQLAETAALLRKSRAEAEQVGSRPDLSRLAARLGKLSHAQLLELAVAGCEASPEVTNRADAVLAAHKPLAQWAVEGVLLSSDLLPHVLGPLQLQDGAAAAVCSLWANSFKATSEGRRRLTRVAFDFPHDLLTCSSVELTVVTAVPGTEEQLVVNTDGTVRIFDRSMNAVLSFNHDYDFSGPIIADAQSIYATAHGTHYVRLAHDGMVDAIYEDPDGYEGFSPVFAPGGLLFCVRYDEEDHGLQQDEIVALDAHSLQPRFQFGMTLFNDARGMAVVGEELFVCDRKNDRLQVFSLAGEHRRSITGEWKRPSGLCLVKDRLYLIETCDSGERDDAGGRLDPLIGQRIFVLSVQGNTLQVYPIPIEGSRFCSLISFDGKLLAPYSHANDDGHIGISGILAMVGV